MQCRCQFVPERVCVSREQYAQVRKVVLGRLDNASPCVCMCVFFQRMCVTNNTRMCHLWRDMNNGRTHHPHPDAPHRHRHRHTHTDNHTTTHQTTQTHHTARQPTPTHPGGTRRAHELEAKVFSSVVHGRVFSSGNKGFFEVGPSTPQPSLSQVNTIGCADEGLCIFSLEDSKKRRYTVNWEDQSDWKTEEHELMIDSGCFGHVCHPGLHRNFQW